MSDIVLDASAVLAVLQGESGADEWADTVEGAALSAVNFSEAGAKLLETGMPVERVLSVLDALSLEVVAFDRDQAVIAAQLRVPTRQLGLSLGDRACLALARVKRLPVLTADRLWERLKMDVKIHVLR